MLVVGSILSFGASVVTCALQALKSITAAMRRGIGRDMLPKYF
jgi:hypothetical protein